MRLHAAFSAEFLQHFETTKEKEQLLPALFCCTTLIYCRKRRAYSCCSESTSKCEPCRCCFLLFSNECPQLRSVQVPEGMLHYELGIRLSEAHITNRLVDWISISALILVRMLNPGLKKKKKTFWNALIQTLSVGFLQKKLLLVNEKQTIVLFFM